MITLYIDTSSSYLYTAIIKNDKLISCINEELGKDMSAFSLQKISMMLNDSSIKPKDITNLIAVNGPGSFTGIRVGLSIAKTWAWTLNIPITTITSLEAMALSVEGYDYLVPAINARRNQVFAGIYDKNMKKIIENQHISCDNLVDNIVEEKSYTIITNDDIFNNHNKAEYNPNYLKIVNYIKEQNIKPTNPHIVEPIYLKLTEAEEKKNENNKSQ